MEPDNFISFVAILISVVSLINQYGQTKRSNQIQSETYRLSQKMDDFENRKGEILLLNIIGRYFVIQLNYLETPGKPIFEVDKEKYLSGLKQLSDDFNELASNPFYIKFIELHPDINLLILSLRGAIIEQEDMTDHKINPQTFTLFLDMYYKLKEEIKNSQVFDHEFYRVAEDAAKFMLRIIQGKTE